MYSTRHQNKVCAHQESLCARSAQDSGRLWEQVHGAGEGEVGVAGVQPHAALAQGSPAGHGLVNKKCRGNVLVAGDGGEDVFFAAGRQTQIGTDRFLLDGCGAASSCCPFCPSCGQSPRTDAALFLFYFFWFVFSPA